MHVWKRVARVVGTVVGFVVRRRRLTVAVVVALLLIGPLALTRDGEVFVLNALGTRHRDADSQAARAVR